MVSAKITDSGLFHAFVIRIANKGCYVDSTTHQWQLTRHRWVRWNQSETFFAWSLENVGDSGTLNPWDGDEKRLVKCDSPRVLLCQFRSFYVKPHDTSAISFDPCPWRPAYQTCTFYRINLPFERRVGSHKFCWGWGPPLWMGTWWPLENVSSPTVSSCQFRSF